MNNKEFIEILKNIAIEYDKKSGCYPEHEFEGISFYHFACEKLEIESDLQKIVNENKELYGNSALSRGGFWY